jgi:hypothetical protein
VSSYCYICVLILMSDVSTRTHIAHSARVLILLYMCPHTDVTHTTIYVSSQYCYSTGRARLRLHALHRACSARIYVSTLPFYSCYYICVLIPLLFHRTRACVRTRSTELAARRRYLVYLLYWYKSTNTDAAAADALRARLISGLGRQ